MSTLKATYLQQASSASPNITLDASTNATVAGTLAMGYSFKRNRIINGDMRVDQRATAVSTDLAYAVDRWKLQKSNDATESVAQNSDAPTGFSYSLRNTISVADTSIGATQYSALSQFIEGYNVADLAFGTASAKTVTISFWIRSSVTGQYTGNIRNSDDSRVCPFGFTISVANTWEFKTVTLAGCTDGTWNTTNSAGLLISFYAALGSTYSGGTAGTWTSTGSIKYGVSSPVNALASNGNIFAITGVQLETGSIATPYERQIYSEQLSQCLRYYQIYRGSTTGSDIARMFTGYTYNTTQTEYPVVFSTQMRAAPTLSNSAVSGIVIVANGTSYAITALNIYQASSTAALLYTTNSTLTANWGVGLGNAAAATSMYIAFSSEL